MPVTAKICGLSTPGTIDAAVRHGASHVGLVFFPPSPRDVGFDQARALLERVPPHVGKVGVFVDPDDTLIEAACASGIDTAQLHKVSPDRAAAIRRRIPVWAAIAVKTRADLQGAAMFSQAADRIVYDAKTPEGAALPGGMGVRFDWQLLQGHRHPLPWALSGGLDPANVAEAARTTGAALVDVSSGVERAPGVKDVDKIAAFLKALSEL
jgi:phosphoribosylanthranilate isomerase